MAEIVVEFGSSQPIGALREAAYRLIGEASCQIDQIGEHHVCRLLPKNERASDQAVDTIRMRFLDLVTDANLREKVAAETEGVRNVIVALAFGAIARERDGSG
jgi:His-Xaa-Ser system protein HxsD